MSAVFAGAVPQTIPIAIRKISCGLFSLLLPDECRVCGKALENISRIPVCNGCLDAPKPMAADYACICCGMAFTNDAPLDKNGRCAVCRRGLWGFDAAYSFGFYEAELRRLLHIFKYEKVYTLAPLLAKRMRSALPRNHGADVIVPVPMHWRKRVARGFNQAELLSSELARSIFVPVEKVLRRPRAGAAQASMSFSERRASMRRDAFTVVRPEAVEGRRVLLIDDVFTTGATARACAKALKRAGAAHVTLLTLARVDRRPIVTTGRSRSTAAMTGGN